MNCVRRLISALLALTVVLTLFSGLGPVTAQAETRTDTAPEDARMEEIANQYYSNLGIKEYIKDNIHPELVSPNVEVSQDHLHSSAPKITGDDLMAYPADSENAEPVQQGERNDIESIGVAVNPLYQDVLSEEDISFSSEIDPNGDVAVIADPVYVRGEVNAAIALRESMVNRETAPVIYYAHTRVPSSGDELGELVDAMIAYAYQHTGVPDEGDYINIHYSGRGNSNLSYYYDDSDDLYYCELTVELAYSTTAVQESQVDKQIDTVLSNLNVSSASAYKKIKAIYDYICKNISLDQDGSMKNTTYGALSNKTANIGGYVSLFYRLALELGVDARVIAGDVDSQGHFWNIAELDNLYYNLDVAMDAVKNGSTGQYDYFLKGSNSFTSYVRRSGWDTDDFHDAHPMSAKDYVAADTTSVAINSTNFPDANFRSYISSNLDTDGNGSLSSAELGCTEIDVSESSISSLEGIEFFADLLILYCDSNKLTSLDVSNNKALGALVCNGNQLSSLDISKNTNLQVLNCGENPLSSLNLTKNTALEFLACHSNGLSNLDVTKNTGLVTLYCHANELNSLDVTKNTALKTLYCSTNNLSALDLSKNTALETLRFEENMMTSMDLSKNTKLVALYCFDNRLTSLNISKCTALEELACQRNNLSTLDLSKNTALWGMYCYDNPLGSLDVSKNTELIELSCSKNNLTTLDLSKNTALITLYCTSNQLTTLDVSRNTALQNLYCYYNQLTSLDLSKNTALKSLDSTDNEYAIKLSSKKFDLSSLPGNFQTSKASNWTNGSVSGSTLTVKDTASPVTYDYNCGNGHVVTFTLNPGASVNNIKRVEGKTPYEIAINSADLLKQVYDVNKFNNIILACGGFGAGDASDNGFADALTGSFLAAQKKAPILMHYGDKSVSANFAYLKENLASGGTVYILGGPVSVPEEVEDELRDAGLKVKRLAGDDRFLTNLAILEEADVGRQEILITSGWGFADSLSVGATGLPILVVNSGNGKLLPEQIEFLEEYKNNTFTVIGGEAAVSKKIKTAVEDVLGRELGRTYGDSREETSVAIAEKYFSKPDMAVLAYSYTFPAGLCGGPLACAMKVPLLLTNGNKTPTKITKAYLEEMNITAGYVMGSTGENALSDSVVRNVFGITTSGAIPSA